MTTGKHTLLRQHGFTLIEFMIAMAMSLFCILAMAGIYMGVKSGFMGQGGLSEMQESQRLSITSLTNTVQLAGYFLNPQSGHSTDTVFSQADATNGFAAGQFISAPDSHTLGIRFQTAQNDGILTCLGTSNTDTALKIYTNLFVFDSAAKTLSCKVFDETSTTPASAVLASNISSFQVAYGVDADGDGNVDYYATTLAAGSPLWKSVKSVRIGLTFVDQVNSTPGNPQAAPNTIVQYISIMNSYYALQKQTST